MRREFTVISGVSMAISFAAAVVLCVQVSQLPGLITWEIAPYTVWALEVAVFGTAVYIWRPTASLGGWSLGILALVALRTSLNIAAAVTLIVMQGSGHFAPTLASVSALAPRLCAAAFSLMVFYPLRLLLPTRAAPELPDASRFADSEAVGVAEAHDKDGAPSVVVLSEGEKVPFWQADDSPSDSVNRPPAPTFGDAIDGTFDLPLHLLLSLVPAELASAKQIRHQESQVVPIPLASIIPQLKEARILVSLAELYEWLPSGAMKKLPRSEPDLAGETDSVVLPLEWVVPRLPPDALELPPPSPPAWAEVEEDEPVVFATT